MDEEVQHLWVYQYIIHLLSFFQWNHLDHCHPHLHFQIPHHICYHLSILQNLILSLLPLQYFEQLLLHLLFKQSTSLLLAFRVINHFYLYHPKLLGSELSQKYIFWFQSPKLAKNNTGLFMPFIMFKFSNFFSDFNESTSFNSLK